MKLTSIRTALIAFSTLVAPLAWAQTPASAYADAVLQAKPLAYWQLNETDDPSAGTVVAVDSVVGLYNGTYGTASQNGFNGIMGPVPTDFPGFEDGNTALQTSGAGSSVTAPQPVLNANTFTIVAWLHPNGSQPAWAGILMNRSGNGEGFGFNDRQMLAYTWNGNTTWSYVSGLVVPQGEWSFVALVIEPSQATLYLGTNGVLTSAVNAVPSINEAWGGNAAIGEDPGGGRVFNGIVDEVAIFKRSLTFDDLNTLYGTALGVIQTVPPTITKQPTSKTLYAGRTATFQVGASGSEPLTYQWMKGGVALNDGGNISGSTSATLTISGVSATEAGDYTVSVSNSADKVTSDPATLALGPAAPTAAYEKAIIGLNPLAYWQLNETEDPSAGNVVAYDYLGGYNGTYGIAAQNGFSGILGPEPPDFPGFEDNNSALQTGLSVDSVVTASQTILNTNAFTVIAWIHPNASIPAWSGILMNRSGNGEGFGFNDQQMLGYTWNNNTTWSYVSGLVVPQNQWSFVAMVIEPSQATLWLGTGGVLTNAVNAVASASEAWGGTAGIGIDPGFGAGRVFNGMVDEVAIFNQSLGSTTIADLYGLGLGTVVAPTITKQPGSVTLYAGGTATFKVVATGSSLTYQWMKGGVALTDGGKVSGATTDTLTLTGVLAADADDYTVNVSNLGGTVPSNPATLTIIAPTGVYENAVLADKPLAYWRLNETQDPASGTTVAYDYVAGYNGTYGTASQNGFNSIIGPVPPDFPGLEDSNSALQTDPTTEASAVTVPQPDLTTNALTITAWVHPNGTVSDWSGIVMDRSTGAHGLGFGGSGQGSQGMLAYTWNGDSTWQYVSGLKVPENQWSFVAVVLEASQTTLYLGTGGVLTNAVNLVPTAVEHWGGTAKIGDDNCCGTGRTFNGIVDEVAIFDQSLSSDAISTLYGKALGVVLGPTITEQPRSQALYAGLPASFKVRATGASLAYQWKKGGVKLTDGGNISGTTTDTLTLSSIAAGDAGDYTVEITNPAGPATSDPAALTVVPLTGAAYETTMLAASPMAYWRLDESQDPSTGTVVAHDFVGGFDGTYGAAALNGFNGILGPQPPEFPGFESQNTALQPTVNTDQSWVTAPQPVLNTNTFSITAWIHPNGDVPDWAGIVMNRSGDGEGLGFGGGSSHGMLGYTWNYNSTWSYVSGLTVPQNQWSFVAMVIEPHQATLYLGTGGVLSSAVDAIDQVNEPWGGTAAFGVDPGGTGRIFNGIVDEVAVFNHSLTPEQIQGFYAAGTPPPQAKLTISRSAGGQLEISWDRPGTLQSTPVFQGAQTVWTEVATQSPVTVTPTGTALFYRVVGP